jgi:hypothetical protein
MNIRYLMAPSLCLKKKYITYYYYKRGRIGIDAGFISHYDYLHQVMVIPLKALVSYINIYFSIRLLFFLFALSCDFTNYTGCRKINVFQVGSFVGKNLRNLEKIKLKI